MSNNRTRQRHLTALAGAAEIRYKLPDTSTATAEYIISLQESHTTHGELEAGSATITLEDGRTTGLTITLTRIVAQVTATFSQLPADVTSVSITLEPLGQQLKLNGTYGTAVGPTTFALWAPPPCRGGIEAMHPGFDAAWKLGSGTLPRGGAQRAEGDILCKVVYNCQNQ